MVLGLILSEAISLTSLFPTTIGRTVLALRHQRRYSRWLGNQNVNVAQLYAPIVLLNEL